MSRQHARLVVTENGIVLEDLGSLNGTHLNGERIDGDMPLTDGDMWFECRLLMEACRFYDLEAVAEMACDKSGFVSHRS